MYESLSFKKCFLITQIVVFLTIENCDCKCMESYVTTCDNISDIYKPHIMTAVSTTLVFESNPPKSADQMECLDGGKFYAAIEKLVSVTIIGQIKGFCWCCYSLPVDLRLKYLSFVNNRIKILRAHWVLYLRLHKLSLVGNFIEIIEKDVFLESNIEVIDLSNNQLEVIQRSVFDVKTKILILRNNKITYVEEGSFEETLETLDLSYNRLYGIQNGVTAELLIELRLSHNKLLALPNITRLENLRFLDVSYNKIRFIFDNTFETIFRLEILNLDNNELASFDFIIPIFRKFKVSPDGSLDPKLIYINLCFNMIKELNEDILTHLTGEKVAVFAFFGNPFSCKSWNIFEKLIHSNRFVYQEICDERKFGSGVVPYCIAKDGILYQEDISKFRSSIENGKGLHKCALEYTYAKGLEEN